MSFGRLILNRCIASGGTSAASLVAFNLGNFVGGQETTTGTAGPAHGMVVSRLVEVRLASFRRQPELLFELLSRDASLENAVELLCVDVEW
ncbi:hypothetical protein HYQ46_003509 [Verticillium longisporum]|nr:hypothetical protein HYQ46_003509 [Verticillium longisporum]